MNDLAAPQIPTMIVSRPKQLHTEHAQMGSKLGDLIELRFGQVLYGSRRLVLTRPDGPSTSGGRQARQNVLLVDARAPTSQGSLVIGWIDLAQNRGALKSWERMFQDVGRGHTKPQTSEQLGITPAEYKRALETFSSFVRMQDIAIRFTSAQETPSVQHAPQAVPWGRLCAAFVSGFALCVLLTQSGVLR